MPRRKYLLSTGEIYHIYNRASGKVPIFENKRNAKMFISLIDFYRYPNRLRYSFFNALTVSQKVRYLEEQKKNDPYVKIYAFAIMNTHFHLLLYQNSDQGILSVISSIQNSFAKYYNLKNDRNGSLFQGPFRAKRVESNRELLHVSRYIHLNPVTSFYIENDELDTYPYTSFGWYLKPELNRFVETQQILSGFKTASEYSKFVKNRADYQRSLKHIEQLRFD